MAQAPKQPFQGPPRKTTTYKSFAGMNSQDERYGVETNEFFLLENIMRVADGKLHSVPGPSAIKAIFPNVDFCALLLETGDLLLLETGYDFLLEQCLTNILLLETGDDFLLETGDNLELDG